MNFNELYKRIAELDTKATEVKEITEAASASINMTGDNAEDVIKLMNSLKGQDNAKDMADMPVAIKSKEPMMAPAMGPMDSTDDMAKLRDIVKGPDMDKDMDDLKPGDQGEPCKVCGKNHLGASSCNDSIENDEDSIENEADDGYENEPDETYQDQHYMTKDLSGGSEMGQKKSYPKAAGGDNAMALEDEIRNELQAQLEKHMGMGEGDDEDGDHDHDDTCPECGEPGKKKLMACASCGCS